MVEVPDADARIRGAEMVLVPEVLLAPIATAEASEFSAPLVSVADPVSVNLMLAVLLEIVYPEEEVEEK